MAIDEDSSKLIDSALALEGVAREQGGHGGQRRVAAERLHGEGDCLPLGLHLECRHVTQIFSRCQVKYFSVITI